MPLVNPTLDQVLTTKKRIAIPHWQKLQDCGLGGVTIHRAKLYTESNLSQLGKLLKGRPMDVKEGLVIPFFGPDSKPIDYCLVRPHTPRIRDGKAVKYEAPRGMPPQPYFPPGFKYYLNNSDMPLVITEGPFKALKCIQAGIPCIGLTGVWNWTVRRDDKTKPRELLPALEDFGFVGRDVVVIFDADTTNNKKVNHAAAELVRVLHDRGANVSQLEIPHARTVDGYMKMGLDDFICAIGSKKFGDLLKKSTTVQNVSMEVYRSELAKKYEAATEHGIYHVRSPLGTGKTHQAIRIRKRMGEMQTLSLQPSVKLAEEVAEAMRQQGLPAMAFPDLKQDCLRVDEIDGINAKGLSVAGTMCWDCTYLAECPYRLKYQQVFEIQHMVGTHKRSEVQMLDLLENREYITIDEDPAEMLRPCIEVEGDLSVVATITRQTYESWTHDYFLEMARISTELDRLFVDAKWGEEVGIPKAAKAEPPQRLDRHLLGTIQRGQYSGVYGNAMRLVKAVADGKVERLMVDYREWFDRAGKKKMKRVMIGFLRTHLPTNMTVLINDSTNSKVRLEAVLGRKVTDATPDMTLKIEQSVRQIPLDVTRRTKKEQAIEILTKAIELDGYQRAGVITHSNLMQAISECDVMKRIAKLSYFGGTEFKGSNEWIKQCDGLIVMGTPRVPPNHIVAELRRQNLFDAAELKAEDVGWNGENGKPESDYWSGTTENGKRVTVSTMAYRDLDWKAAYDYVIRSQLWQALGRARYYMNRKQGGIPAIVITKENLGLPLVDGVSYRTTNPSEEMVLTVLSNEPLHRKAVAELTGLPESTAKDALNRLVEIRTVRKVSPRGGYVLTAGPTK